MSAWWIIGERYVRLELYLENLEYSLLMEAENQRYLRQMEHNVYVLDCCNRDLANRNMNWLEATVKAASTTGSLQKHLRLERNDARREEF
jgi:hypothetical protein